uniref:Uncharacterized protein n=1 Tax=Cyanoderma ruficeps TaxID=181631 RepID=A0A8C3QU58_9PASS
MAHGPPGLLEPPNPAGAALGIPKPPLLGSGDSAVPSCPQGQQEPPEDPRLGGAVMGQPGQAGAPSSWGSSPHGTETPNSTFPHGTETPNSTFPHGTETPNSAQSHGTETPNSAHRDPKLHTPSWHRDPKLYPKLCTTPNSTHPHATETPNSAHRDPNLHIPMAQRPQTLHTLMAQRPPNSAQDPRHSSCSLGNALTPGMPSAGREQLWAGRERLPG